MTDKSKYTVNKWIIIINNPEKKQILENLRS